MDVLTDTSTLLAVVLNEPEKDEIIKMTAGHDLVAPGSVVWEVGNALSAMLKKKRLRLPMARKAFQIFDAIPIRYLDTDIIHALKIASDCNIYAYDAYILECALRHKKPLISLDGMVMRNAKDLGIRVWEVKK